MRHQGYDFPMCDTVASQLVRHETERSSSLTLQELAKESSRRTPVPAGLDEDIDHIAILIHSPPEILALTIDTDEHFVQEPGVAETTLTTFQSAGVLGSKLDRPLPNRFISHVHAALSEQVFDLPKAQTESKVEPDSVADDLWWKSVPEVAGPATYHSVIVRRGGLT